jgi:hypothetical protein
VWIEKQVHVDGPYTTYTWTRDATKAMGNDWRTGSRPITIAEGFAVRGDRPDLPITEELMDRIHQTYVQYLNQFFAMTQKQWVDHKADQLHLTEMTFEIPTAPMTGEHSVSAEDIGHLPTQSFIGEKVQRAAARLEQPAAAEGGVDHTVASTRDTSLARDPVLDRSFDARYWLKRDLPQLALWYELSLRLEFETRDNSSLSAIERAEFSDACRHLAAMRTEVQLRYQTSSDESEPSRSRRPSLNPFRLFSPHFLTPDEMIQLKAWCDKIADVQADMIGYEDKQRVLISWYKDVLNGNTRTSTSRPW